MPSNFALLFFSKDGHRITRESAISYLAVLERAIQSLCMLLIILFMQYIPKFALTLWATYSDCSRTRTLLNTRHAPLPFYSGSAFFVCSHQQVLSMASDTKPRLLTIVLLPMETKDTGDEDRKHYTTMRFPKSYKAYLYFPVSSGIKFTYSQSIGCSRYRVQGFRPPHTRQRDAH